MKDTVQVRKRINHDGGKTADAGVVVLSASELDRIRETGHVLSKEEEIEMKQKSEELYEARMKKSRERKERMMQMEEERKRNALLSDVQQDMRTKTNGVLEKAKQMMDEEMDDVKHMNQMMLYSKVVTIRDAQVQEKRIVQAEKEEEERALDTMMEIERLKGLQLYEEREKTRLQNQRVGAAVITDQIRDRQAARMRQEEERDHERAFVLKQIEALKAEEVEQQNAKKMAAAKLMKEVNEANSAAMKIKEEKMISEKLEEKKILDYQEYKEKRERDLEEEKARLAAEKERETARLRAMQEKAQDKAAEMDGLRAKRAMEANERNAREKVRREQGRLEAINQELNRARSLQQSEKERRLAEQAKFERDEFERIIEVQMAQEEAEKIKQAEERAMRRGHVDDLRSQIAAREERSLQDRRDFLEEGNVIRAQIGNERNRLERIKARKIEELKKAGVPEKYRAELSKKKISV